MSNIIDDIKKRAGITEQEQPQITDQAAAQIYKNVLNAMQDAEEMGGPEGDAYIVLMSAIAMEAKKRIRTFTKMHRS